MDLFRCPKCSKFQLESTPRMDTCLNCGYFFYYRDSNVVGDTNVTNDPENQWFNKRATPLHLVTKCSDDYDFSGVD